MPEGEKTPARSGSRLTNPLMIGAFAGWNDAGEAATGVIDHLAECWDAEPLAEIDPDDYYDFQVNRPTVRIAEDGVRTLEWPTTRLLIARPGGGDRDVVLVRGIEPNMRWRAFCEELMTHADELGVRDVIMLGALLADVPHTRPVPVTVSGTDDGLARSLGVEWSRYEGPTGIVGVLQNAAAQAGWSATSLWGAVPHYVSQSPCPKATLVLVQKIEDLLDLSIPLGDLPDEAQAWQHGVEELATEDPDVAEYVKRLEEARDTTELPEASGEHIAREFERYLRRRTDS
ncbi:MAG TPA: PAC2 family protein [Jiangellaceae bacterium]|jgi:proteasome assembly chaperone (PAC2) family protein|nr:PAC2 family protein [Jiangellaceae bacterium]